jgi:hypothetical protein
MPYQWKAAKTRDATEFASPITFEEGLLNSHQTHLKMKNLKIYNNLQDGMNWQAIAETRSLTITSPFVQLQVFGY